MTDRPAPDRTTPARPARAKRTPPERHIERHAERHAERPLVRRRPRAPEAGSDQGLDAGLNAGFGPGPGGPGDGRLFVSALARGLEVLGCFRIGDAPLGNQELARRSGLPKPTVSRLTYTLTQLGYLTFDPRGERYELGGRCLALGHTALANVDVRRVAQPLMRGIAERWNLNVALTVRDGLSVLAVETCEGRSLIGLRLAPGMRMPLATTSAGKAYLATVAGAEREAVLGALRDQHGAAWPGLLRAVGRAKRGLARDGFCLSVGEWQSDINAAGAAIVLPSGTIYALSLAGPAYLVDRARLETEYGPGLAEAARRIERDLGGGGTAPESGPEDAPPRAFPARSRAPKTL